MRTLVTFQIEAFNPTDPKDHFLNLTCFGDDFARWLVSRLREGWRIPDKDLVD
ncbi:MAG: hypothetical protein H6751_12400 [Candidatus Omnitrophica bacterium]|nr:hypothetical protein [Candidatus Omnitrophota bacterium]MCB9783756.1 hypothetical protein [Candidatus Omnitrophota bacterium]